MIQSTILKILIFVKLYSILLEVTIHYDNSHHNGVDMVSNRKQDACGF